MVRLATASPTPSPRTALKPGKHGAVIRRRLVEAAVGACVTGGVHVGCGLIAAHLLWGGRDSPAEWTLYYAGAGSCLLPLTGTLAWSLTRVERTRSVGQGAVVGLLVATAVAVVAVAAGWAPPWASHGWTGGGWGWSGAQMSGAVTRPETGLTGGSPFLLV